MERAYKKYNYEFLLALSISLINKKDVRSYLKRNLNIDLRSLKKSLNSNLKEKNFDSNYKKLFLKLLQNGLKADSKYIDMDILFYTLSKDYWMDALLEVGVTGLQLDCFFEWKNTKNKLKGYSHKLNTLYKIKPVEAINRAYKKRATPLINKYAVDYTSKIIREGFAISIGKEKYLESILQKDKDSNILVIGSPGVGKTHLLKNLASAIVAEDISKELVGMRLVVLDIGRVLIQTSSFKEFERIVKEMIDEVDNSSNIIFVFENIEYIFQIKSEGNQDLINFLTSFIQGANFRIICTANSESYFKIIKQNIKFSSLFEVIEIQEASPEITFQIMVETIPSLEKHYQVKIMPSGISKIVSLAEKIHHEKAMPDKGIKLLEDVILFSKARGYKKIDSNIVEEMIKSYYEGDIGNIHEDEKELIEHMEQVMHRDIVGQDRAVRSIISTLKRARSGIKNRNKPIASFLFFGPSGVGQVAIAKTISNIFYGHKRKMIKLNMSEYGKEESIDKLIGGVEKNGEFFNGLLSEKIKKQPYSLIFLNEFEKANKKTINLFLQLMDQGCLTDYFKQEIDFRNIIIIATSNTASKEISEMLLNGKSYREVEKNATNLLKKNFSSEFLHKFDKLVMFKNLNIDETEHIVQSELKILNERLSENGITISWDSLTVKEITKIGYNPISGIKQIRIAITEFIKDKIADAIIAKKIKKGQTIYFKGLEISYIL